MQIIENKIISAANPDNGMKDLGGPAGQRLAASRRKNRKIIWQFLGE